MHIWQENIKMTSKETGCANVDQIQVTQNRVQQYAHNNTPLGSTQGREFLNHLNDYQLLNKDSTS